MEVSNEENGEMGESTTESQLTNGDCAMENGENGHASAEEGQPATEGEGEEKKADGHRSSSHKSSHHKSSHHKSSHHKSSHHSSSKDGERRHSSHHKSSHHSSSKDKDGERRHSSHHKSSHHKSSSGDKDRHSSHHKSSSGDKEHKSSHGDKSHKSSSGDKEHRSSSSQHKSSHHKSSSGDKDHKSSSRDKDHKSSHGDKEHRSSSSHRHSSSHKHSSSSSHHKSSHSDKDRHSSSHKSKHHSRDKESDKVKEEVKVEVGQGDASLDDSQDDFQPAVKEEVASPAKEKPTTEYESDDDIPLSSRRKKEEPPSEEEEEQQEEEDDYKEEDYTMEGDEDDDDDMPLAMRASKKKYDSDEEALSSRKKNKKNKKRKADSDEEDFVAKKKKKNVKILPPIVSPKKRPSPDEENASPKKGKKKKEEDQPEKWRWWEEERVDGDFKWSSLEHKGPLFAPPYERLPDDVHFYYDGERMRLSEMTEELATYYGRMIDHDYTTNQVFNDNFFKDWRRIMTDKERGVIKDLKKCNFKEIDAYYKQKSEERKNRSKEEKKAEKEKNDALIKEMGYCMIDGHKERIANFKIEPPGLFRGRGNHPKMGMFKRRVMPEDVIINCSKGAKVPDPPEGHHWKEIRHDNTVTWLACWVENVQQQHKYIMLNAGSKLKGEKDWQKYEKARKLHPVIGKIRSEYINDFKSKEMRIRQRAVALYFIDRLALRAGNEKDEEQADTVGCCSLRVEHIKLHPEKDGREYVVEFDFLGKDSIRYNNSVPVEKRVYKNVQLFMENKKPEDDLFDRLNTTILNQHLHLLMDGLTAKVFRTYNASKTLEEQLDELTNPDDKPEQKLLSYNRANRKVAILCNHQRAVPKTFEKSMENLEKKISEKRKIVKDAKKEWKELKKSGSSDAQVEKKKAAYDRLNLQLKKLEISRTDKDEGKEIALGTSKLNYLDPRISVAWAKKWEIPMTRVYNKTQRDKFAWAIDMAEADYSFRDWNSDH